MNFHRVICVPLRSLKELLHTAPSGLIAVVVYVVQDMATVAEEATYMVMDNDTKVTTTVLRIDIITTTTVVTTSVDKADNMMACKSRRFYAYILICFNFIDFS